ncbi:hypothetical protein JJQ72_13055 [Paenibacillus sp. F411]|uniref:hypothetical protein n=1 Tax=Paenibacillus sp. F411 TaxID=2820239 RepID=UPI001AAF4F4F|nr:hypothetical protein [Paenibacillus sp. F411]MBO2944900.1 hypothetical protein [Paenibacillus sp. F411]
MMQLLIIPGKAIGKVNLGMDKSETETLIENSPIFYNIEYDDYEKVSFIEVANGAKDFYQCLIPDLNLEVFETKASDIVEMLTKNNVYDEDEESLAGLSYRFSDLGIAFWRPYNLKEEDTLEQWFKEMTPENQHEEMKNFYFESISVFNPE